MSGDREATSEAALEGRSGTMRFEAAIRPLLLDGGLATALEDEGYVLDDPLWSAALVSAHPDAIRRMHARYLDAGADVITTATYQATFQGLSRAWGRRSALTRAESAKVFRDAVGLADEARREHAERTGRWSYVAASVGSYGAYLADGSEYRGRYGASRKTLLDVHAPRLDVLGRDPRVDVVACETVPSGEEALLLAELLVARGVRGWVSVVVDDLVVGDLEHDHDVGSSVPDDTPDVRLADGTPLHQVAEAIASLAEPHRGGEAAAAVTLRPTGAHAEPAPTLRTPRVGIGINCVRPSRVTAALPVLTAAGVVEIAAYANAGESFGSAGWCGKRADPIEFAVSARAWVAAGATIVGGCCRTTPAHVAALRQTLHGGG